MRRGNGGRFASERGAASVEAVIVIPAVLLLVGLALIGGRYWYASTAVDEAAWVAARSASLERTPDAGQRTAHHIATTNLSSAGTECVDLQVRINASGLTAPVGQPATVTVDVQCRVPLADLLVPGAPGSIVVSGHATSVVDRHRGRP